MAPRLERSTTAASGRSPNRRAARATSSGWFSGNTAR